MWDERYGQPGFTFGERPNDFVAEQAGALGRGACLCLAEGQGRNAVWLAEQGFVVTAMDQSAVGMARAQELAHARGVTITTEVGDLATYDLGAEKWDVIVSIFVHLPPDLRRDLHRRVVRALKPGGTFLLEAYTPDQIGLPAVGGPRVPEMLMREADLRMELAGLGFSVAREIRRDVQEGDAHRGHSAVVQIVARKSSGE